MEICSSKSLYFHFLLGSMFFIVVVFAIDPYSEALLSLKSELITHSDSLNDWVVPSKYDLNEKSYSCFWSGVTCNHNNTIVIGLDLSRKNIGGEISGKQFNVFTQLVDLNMSHNFFSGHFPVAIFNLTNLRSLDINRNNFSGNFPAGISSLQNLVVLDAFSNSFSGSLPIEVSEIGPLKILNLAGSYFNGEIPSQYGNFKNLEFIHFAGNFLSGKIPPELGNLKTVTHMEIGYNSYHGSIPWQLGNMSELQYLDISGANISGSIPSQLSNLTKLQSFFLFRNQITGIIPSGIGNIMSLTDLDLSDNQISGSIPESFSELKNLKLLSLMYNQMSGTVPQGIAELPLLDTLFLWTNFFSGNLPKNLGKNSNLKWLDVSTNNFNGTIPSSLCSNNVLVKLILFSNNFTGDLSESLSNCSSLVRLRIEDNSFSGKIPIKFSKFPNLQYIDMSKNRFNGGISIDISQASKLEYFNISDNPELGGLIPENIWSLAFLKNFSAYSCNISGKLPSFSSCESITVVELAMNNISGDFPENISNCKNLEKMDLSNNHLIGYISEEIADLPVLGVLDLSHNFFNGSIPENFSNSSSLRLLNVSFNDLSGTIPSNDAFKFMGIDAFVGNPNLCGAPLHPCPNSKEMQNGLTKLTMILMICVGLVLFALVSMLVLYYFQRKNKVEWKMVSYTGLPRFTANDVLKSIGPASVCKAVLPTGITVSVKKMEFEAKKIKFMINLVSRMGNARNKNLIRLLGICYNNQEAYLLYDYLPNGNLDEKIRRKIDWETKYKIAIGVAKGLCYLHHDCYPAICHGDLKTTNIMLDENMEPQLGKFGFKFLLELNKASFLLTGEITAEVYMDIYRFGQVLLAILTNGRLTNAGENIHSKPKETLLREIYKENDVEWQDEIKTVVDVALLCTRTRSLDRPSMEDVLKLLLGSKSQQQFQPVFTD